MNIVYEPLLLNLYLRHCLKCTQQKSHTQRVHRLSLDCVMFVLTLASGKTKYKYSVFFFVNFFKRLFLKCYIKMFLDSKTLIINY